MIKDFIKANSKTSAISALVILVLVQLFSGLFIDVVASLLIAGVAAAWGKVG